MMTRISKSRRFRYIFSAAGGIAIFALFISSCNSIDCPLKNTVSAGYSFYDYATGSTATFNDTLTVTAIGSDTVLYNRGTGIASLRIPVAYAGAEDTLLLHISSTSSSRTDTLLLGHTNTAHFESIDCNPAVFHRITGVRLIPGEAVEGLTKIDSVALVNAKVDYNEVGNIKVYITAP